MPNFIIKCKGLVGDENATEQRVIDYALNRLEANPEDAIEYLSNVGMSKAYLKLLRKAMIKMTLTQAKEIIASYGEEVVVCVDVQ